MTMKFVYTTLKIAEPTAAECGSTGQFIPLSTSVLQQLNDSDRLKIEKGQMDQELAPKIAAASCFQYDSGYCKRRCGAECVG